MPKPGAMEEETVRLALSASTILGRLDRVPYLFALRGEATGEVYLLEKEETILGRGTDADIVVKDPGVSRHHASLLNSQGKLILRDLGSTNGTFVAERGLAGENVPVVLVEGEHFGLGPVSLFKLGFASIEDLQRP